METSNLKVVSMTFTEVSATRKMVNCAAFSLSMFLMAPTIGHAESITFDELGPAPCSFASAGPLDNEYAGRGVTFSGGWEILDECGNFGVNALSGDSFAAYNTSTSGITNRITMVFDAAISSISGVLGSGRAGTWNIVGVLNGSAEGASSVVNAGGSYVGFALSGLFDTVFIQGSASYGVLENLNFTTSTAPPTTPVPLPAGGLLLVSGIAVAATLKRLKKRAA
ncbi:VPLPA-CTERM sorting domain-containing protein [Meridianimarinicoccus aquatilis]|uniref:VPLPA-CTERM sorting domain-containing protein n=1 Tax=Meridianimarinicoccus aquatilis TaxID=2552766 RepID=A0A4R6AKB7_9RHOB|nr:VPLPA-CTERM sorting domain-containing protein [Fluviibacterium aquatile]TDL83825.1 VPLPA-CTERM sorting domain-containing protein [Fluviibacterium aquatile]